MRTENIRDYYISRKSKILKRHTKILKFMRKVLISYYDDDFILTLIKETRQEFENLIPKLPYIGGKKNKLTKVLIESALYLAFYRVMNTHGKSVEEAGKIIYETVEAFFKSLPIETRKIMGRVLFFKYVFNKSKKRYEKLLKYQYPGNWVIKFINGNGRKFDFGLDYNECGVVKFFHAQDADEFTRFICLTAFPYSKAVGTGLIVTKTIAEGAEKCEFRFKRGREVKQGWPPEFLK